MKTKLNKIAQDLEQSNITDNEARNLLLDLLIVSENILNEHQLTINKHDYGIYQLRQDGEYIMESDKLECHKRARVIVELHNSDDVVCDNPQDA